MPRTPGESIDPGYGSLQTVHWDPAPCCWVFHIYIFKHLQTSQPPAENAVNEVPSTASRFRLDMLKNKAKRSLTESFESILSRVSIIMFIASEHNFIVLFIWMIEK